MNRRSFMAGLAGLPIVGWVASMFGLSKSKAESGITVHGPELIVVHGGHSNPMAKGTVVELPAGYDVYQPRPTLSLRFENVPVQENLANSTREMLNRLRPLCGTVNRSHWHWRRDVECAQSLMFTDFGISLPENGSCSVICAFTSTLGRRPWPGSHRPVDFETEILKALEGNGHRRRV